MKSLVLPGVKTDTQPGSRRRFLIASEKVGKKRSVQTIFKQNIHLIMMQIIKKILTPTL